MKLTFLKLVIILPLAAVCLSCGRAPDTGGNGTNLLLISVDTLRADRLGCYGYARDTSPRVDALAAEGTLFESSFSTSPKTTPSHMSIMTGLYPRAHNVYMWGRRADGAYTGKSLSADVPTLAEVLARNGYTNAAFTEGGNVAGKFGFDRGFEVYTEDGDTGAACRWIEENAGKPFFLFYHTYFTHDPYLPPPPYDTKFDPSYEGRIPSRDTLREMLGVGEDESTRDKWHEMHKQFWLKVDINDPREMQHVSALYDGSIAYVDEAFVGRLVEALREAGVLDTTLIVFTSDHGEEFLEHGRLRHESVHREVNRVPLLMRLPGTVPEGKRVTQIVRGIDVMPTVLDLLGIPGAPEVQGVSLVPAISEDRDLDLAAYADFNDFGPPFVESLRHGPWFYLMDQRRGSPTVSQKKFSPPFTRLFDTGSDPGETLDVSESVPLAADRMRRKMEVMRIESSRMHEEKASDQESRAMDKENIERLKALGYL